MSIASNMKEYTLQKYDTVKSPSGAKKQSWVDDKAIMISIFDTSSTLVTNNVKYNESSHCAFTFYKGIDKVRNRLKDIEGNIYTITDCKATGRLTSLLLKKVEVDG